MRPLPRPLLTALLVATLSSAIAAPGTVAAPATPPACVPPTAAPATDRTGPLVATEDVNLRTGPGTACGVIEVLPAGTTVTPRSGAVDADGRDWIAVAVGETTGWLAEDFVRPPGARVAVLMYHHLDVPGTAWSVTTEQLTAQMAWLKEHGYASVTISQLVDALAGTAALPPKAVVITNDDGYPETTRFAAILARYGFVGTYYLPTRIALTADQVRGLEQGGGEVCGHTVAHADLSRLSAERQRAEIVANKRDLEAIVGHPVRCFAYPYGAFDAKTVPILREAGFDSAVDVGGGPVDLGDPLDPYHIPRVQVLGTQTMAGFIAGVPAA